MTFQSRNYSEQRTGGFAEPVHLEQGNVETHEELDGVLHEWCCAADAVLRALQPQRSTDLVKHEPLGQRPAPWQRLTATPASQNHVGS